MEYFEKRSVLFTGCAHFLVDLSCTAMLATLSARLSYTQIIACAIGYNGLAFAFQLPVGTLGDLLKHPRYFSAAGCLLVAFGCLFANPLVLCLLLGLGNAFFHIGGGREALCRSGGKAGMAGAFVAPGALGIFLGPRLAFFVPLKFLLASALLLLAVLFFRFPAIVCQPISEARLPRKRLICAIICMFLTVLLRSYMGTVLQYKFLNTPALALLFTFCIFGGKFFGGFLADRFGLLRFSTAAQLLAGVLFCLSVFWNVLAFPAIFLFNTSMAVTATALYRWLPRFPGTMFGLTTFALFLGVLPRLLGVPSKLFTWWGLGLLGLLSALLLLGGLILAKGGAACASVTGFIPGSNADP